jgi:hypothetical protein
MSANGHEVPSSEWHDSLEAFTKEYGGGDVTIELVSQDFGDQLEAQRLPLFAMEYDHKNDVVVVSVGGRDNRYPVVLRHIVEHPKRILSDSAVPGADYGLDIVDGEGEHTIVTLHRRPATAAC